jgi:PTS system fructose-specific IIC component
MIESRWRCDLSLRKQLCGRKSRSSFTGNEKGIEMFLGKHMNADLVLCDLRSENKMDAIGELVDLFARAGIVEDKESFRDTIRRREELESTAIGQGVAIPHGRSGAVKELKVAFARSKKGIDFKALDKKPVHILFVVAAPENVQKEYLQLIAKIARLSKSKVMREALQKAETAKEVLELIADFDNMLVEEISVKTKQGRVLYRE